MLVSVSSFRVFSNAGSISLDLISQPLNLLLVLCCYLRDVPGYRRLVIICLFLVSHLCCHLLGRINPVSSNVFDAITKIVTSNFAKLNQDQKTNRDRKSLGLSVVFQNEKINKSIITKVYSPTRHLRKLFIPSDL